MIGNYQQQVYAIRKVFNVVKSLSKLQIYNEVIYSVVAPYRQLRSLESVIDQVTKVIQMSGKAGNLLNTVLKIVQALPHQLMPKQHYVCDFVNLNFYQ